MRVEDKTLKALASSLNLRQIRHEILTSNIANADTPGYKAKRVDFEEALQRALDVDGNLEMLTSDEKHFDVGNGGFDNLQPEIYEDPNGIVSEDGNTVDRDAEMAKMAENKILYDASVKLLNKKLGMLKYTINSEK
ncbi:MULTISPECIES: flagellar basal body rod protein FlgB [Halobacteriovorax]|uniref:Flagellar basal body rod protein FlgB n=1 Tax=Halobacteriovorax vibrionivorans TaxID=2152716 RepID=A0ABY0IJH7_9BACT|nr:MULTISPECIES: flagellar basal body rod protein FlgB [Halobacteriovorax]AYF45573.1 flagellar basal-body rod protein FlgB [Halobacteriovorax sp. BALOs_7]RZF22639.1 flagellar basal body rod protein FlgB [Halobacteriovorax vibrionivorans]TGD45764.1 flagellar basal body rod protein FlgB [Halobacteriovorax sp. Y22]